MSDATTLDVAQGAGAAVAGHVPTRQQLILSVYWFALSFQGGALLGVAVPAQLLGLTRHLDKALTLGILGAVAAFVAMVAQPVAGAMSDLSSARWGRRRTYLLAGALIDLVGLAAMAAASSLWLLSIGLLFASLGAGVSGASYQAYVPDHVPAEQYGEASGYIGAMTMIGTVASFGIAALLVTPGTAGSFYIATMAIVAAGAIFTALAVQEPREHDRAPSTDMSWREMWLQPWRSPNFVLVFLTRGMMLLALYMLFTFVEYYVRDVIHVTHFVQGAALVAGVATLTAIVGGVISGWLSDRIGRKPIVTLGSVLMAGALSVLAFAHTLNAVLAMGMVFGIALGALSAVDWALAIDVLPNRAFAAKDMGIWGISTNLPQTIAPLVGGGLLVALSPFGTATGYTALFLLAAACSAGSGALVWRLQGIR
jgi:MFS family permease